MELWNWAEKFRKSEKNIDLPWDQTGIELKIVLDDTVFWIENNTYPPDEIFT